MATLELQNIQKAFGPTQVLHEVNLSVRHGEFVVFVGPSGCGKSTLLRTIAGLETPTGGQVLIDGEVVNSVSAADRGCAMVFQSYALYPHMTVYQNMAFGLENAKVAKDTIGAEVSNAASLLRLDGLLDRKPTQLSGGQRQRVAIGRAIVRQPKIFLFDEPLSNLDAELRVSMRSELRELHTRLGATMIYVTHDQVEAMTLADRIVVLRAGRIEQVGAPRELYERPTNQFVAGFIGSPRMNFVPTAALSTVPLLQSRLHTEAKMIGMRPEHMELAAADSGLPLSVTGVEYMGGSSLVHGHLRDGTRMEALLPIADLPQRGENLYLSLVSDKLHQFDASGFNLAGVSSS